MTGVFPVPRIHRLNSLLKAKEESLRTLKEMMRLQQCDMGESADLLFFGLNNLLLVEYLCCVVLKIIKYTKKQPDTSRSGV